MAKLPGTRTTDEDLRQQQDIPQDDPNQDPEEAQKERLKKAGVDEKKLDESTSETLTPSQAANRGKWDRQNPQQIFDPNVMANNAQANMLGSAAYCANPPKEIQPEEPIDQPDVKWADADKITRALRAQQTGEQAGAANKKTDKSGGAMVSVRLLKGYRPATLADFEVEGSDQVGPGIGGKIAAGTKVKLPEREAHRLLKLKSAEAIPS